jgi:hypothetical protein
MKLFALSLILVTLSAWSQQPSNRESEDRLARSKMCTLNPTNNVVPVRFGATFVDSPLSTDINGNLQIGRNPGPNAANGGLTMTGTLARYNTLEVHNNYAVGIDLFTHADAEFRAPYINLYKSRGTQLAPTPALFTGYEADSIGGINFAGWDGSTYFTGASILSQTDENWTPTNHGAHLSIYGLAVGGHAPQLVQFGGLDATGHGASSNIIFYRAITFSTNQWNAAGIFFTGNPQFLQIRKADNSGDASLTALNVTASGFVAPGSLTVTDLPLASGATGKMFTVSDSTAIIGEGQICVGGSTNTALAFSNGTVWKCF